MHSQLTFFILNIRMLDFSTTHKSILLMILKRLFTSLGFLFYLPLFFLLFLESSLGCCMIFTCPLTFCSSRPRRFLREPSLLPFHDLTVLKSLDSGQAS